jgi:hypothetical protein
LKIFPELSEKIYRPSSQSILLKSGILFFILLLHRRGKTERGFYYFLKSIPPFEIEQEEYFNHWWKQGLEILQTAKVKYS